MATRVKATLAEISTAINLTAGAQQITMFERNLRRRSRGTAFGPGANAWDPLAFSIASRPSVTK
jgi:hypothetical protein